MCIKINIDINKIGLTMFKSFIVYISKKLVHEGVNYGK